MVTLDNLHSKQIKKIKDFDLDKKIERKKDLITLQHKYSDDPIRWLEIKNQIKEIEIQINEFESNKCIDDYYIQTGDVLFQYYDAIENVDSEKKFENVEIKKDSILSYLNSENESNKISADNKKETDNLLHSSDEEDDYIFEKFVSRENLRAEYLVRIHENEQKMKKLSQNYKSDNKLCEICNSEFTHIPSESVMECTKCGHLINIVIDTEKPSYKESPKESCYYSYRRSNHFNEWIAQFQGKETTQIPRQVLQQVVCEIRKERIYDLSKLSNQKIRVILKKLKLNKYYEHIPYIINLLNGKDPPHMTRQQEEKLRIMFQQIQGPFLEFCPKKRKNFLSYSYVLNKFVVLLGLEHLQSLFPLLKSREKLHSQDVIWKQICDKIGWEFRKSI